MTKGSSMQLIRYSGERRNYALFWRVGLRWNPLATVKRPVRGAIRRLSAPYVTFRTLVSSFLLLLMFESVRLHAIMSGVSSISPEKPIWSRFWTTVIAARLDNPVLNLKAISTLRFTTLSIFVKTALWTRLLMPATALSTSSLILSTIFFSMTWLRHTIFSPSVTFSELPTNPSFYNPITSFAALLTWLLLRMAKSFEDAIFCLRNFVFWIFETLLW